MVYTHEVVGSSPTFCTKPGVKRHPVFILIQSIGGNRELKEVFVHGFDDEANSAINRAISTANTMLSDEVSTMHLMMAMVPLPSISEKFYKDTGIEPRSFFSYCMDNYTNTEKEGVRGYLTIEDFTPGLQNLFSRYVHRFMFSQTEIPARVIYDCIIKDTRTEVWRILRLMGANNQSHDVKSNILEDMPGTAQFAVDYNALAASGRFDPVCAREKEIDYTIEVLGRRIKSNPCLVGHAGVGKTAIIEGLAQRIIAGEVPDYLKDKHIVSVDISGIISGAKYRGEFEERLNTVLNEAASNENVILFFDEIHMLIGANSNGDSSMNAANIIKPAISRGDVTIIGATTLKEYKKNIEKDSAFERRFQRVLIEEPSVEQTISMVNAVIDKYNQFHNSKISSDAIELAVVLSDRYITDKKLPDKAITVIDETAAHLKKNVVAGAEILITSKDIKETVSRSTGIDVSDLDTTMTNKLESLASNLHKHVIGQDNAVQSVTKAIRRAKAGVKDPNRPIGSFLFVGPTGVGKTELCKALAREFSGDIKSLIRFDMSEFMEKHSVSKMIGSPPGYVGYGEGGQLTEAVKNNPYSVILFDEIEKAHPAVFNIMLQILDDGVLTDGEGSKVDFKNCIIVMTSNAGYGADGMSTGRIGFGASEDSKEDKADKQEQIALKALEQTFRPEFLNRLDKIVIFSKLTKEEAYDIVELSLKALQSRLKANNIEMSWKASLVEKILEVGYSDKYGARNIKRKVQDIIGDKLADGIIDGTIANGSSIVLSYTDKLVIQFGISLGKESDKPGRIEIDPKDLISNHIGGKV